MAAIASSIFLWKPDTFSLSTTANFPSISTICPMTSFQQEAQTFNGCFVYNDFGIFDLDFNFFVFFTHRSIPDT